jgi:hypothetical protein
MDLRSRLFPLVNGVGNNVTVRILFAVEEAGIATSGAVRCLLRQHCLKSINWVAYSKHGAMPADDARSESFF